GDRDRRPRRRRKEHGRSRRGRAARVRLPRHRGDVPGGGGRDACGRWPARGLGAGAQGARGLALRGRRPRGDRRDPHDRRRGGGLSDRQRSRPAPCPGRAPARADGGRRLGCRGPRHRHGGRPGRGAQGLPDGERRRARGPAGRRARGRPPGRARRSDAARRAGLAPRALAAARGRGRGRARYERADGRRGRVRDRQAGRRCRAL
ncbi:MAG: Cytidylate kinase, partial [uncultured Solirubrobacterales bacterium]